MDNEALALAMVRLAAWMDTRCRPSAITQHRFDGPPFGTAYVCISPSEESPFASANHNRMHLCGAAKGLTAEGVAGLTRLFTEAGVSRFFAWLSPGSDQAAARDWLESAGLSRISYIQYLTLARDPDEVPAAATSLEVRELAPGEVASLAGHTAEVAWPEYLNSAGTPGFFHFMAFDHNEPVASAALCTFEAIGYLCMALTAEHARGRGAQQALISRRIEKARALGCRVLVSETLSITPISLSNLQKAGFRPAYEKEVYSGQAS